MAVEPSNPSTTDRLLEAAGEVFAEVGFRNATVRDICARAGANIAAVNYHFGDKDTLYAAVLTCAQDTSAQQHPDNAGQAEARTPEDRMRAFVMTFMNKLFDEGRPAWQTKLMAREMIEPTAALDQVVARGIRPRFELLSAIVRELLGPGATDDEVSMCGASVIGQCLLYHHCRAVVSRLLPNDPYTPQRARERAAHIVEFSLGGIAAVRARRSTL